MTRKTRQALTDTLTTLVMIGATAAASALTLTGHPEGLLLLLLTIPPVLFATLTA